LTGPAIILYKEPAPDGVDSGGDGGRPGTRRPLSLPRHDSMKRAVGTVLSRVLSYRNASTLVRWAARAADALRIHRFDIFDRIPDESCVIVFKHGFKILGKVADFYLIGAVSPRKVRGLFYPGLFENDFCGPFLRAWGAISTGRLLHIRQALGPDESIAIAVDGLEQFAGTTGYLGAAWIAQKTGLPLVLLKVDSDRRTTRLEVRGRIVVPPDARREELREITDAVFDELSR